MHGIKEINIIDLTVGFHILNLGRVLEIKEGVGYYALVISRMKGKHVFRYPKDAKLWVFPNISNVR